MLSGYFTPDRWKNIRNTSNSLNVVLSAVLGFLGGVTAFQGLPLQRSTIFYCLGCSTIAFLIFAWAAKVQGRNQGWGFYKQLGHASSAIPVYGSATVFLVSLGALTASLVPQKPSFEQTRSVLIATIRSEPSMTAGKQERVMRDFYALSENATIRVRSTTEILYVANEVKRKALMNRISIARRKGAKISHEIIRSKGSRRVYKIVIEGRTYSGLNEIKSYYKLSSRFPARYEHRDINILSIEGNTAYAQSDTWYSQRLSNSWTEPRRNYSEIWKFVWIDDKWKVVAFVGGIPNGQMGDDEDGTKERKKDHISAELEKIGFTQK